MKPQWQRRQERTEFIDLRLGSGALVRVFRSDPRPRHKMPPLTYGTDMDRRLR